MINSSDELYKIMDKVIEDLINILNKIAAMRTTKI